MGLSVFLSPLQDLLNTLQKERHKKDEHIDNLLLELNAAIIETKKYMRESEDGNSYNRSREYKLAMLWAGASVRARYVSSDLASDLHHESLWWSGEIYWNPDELEDAQEEIEAYEAEIRRLLEKN